MQYNGASVAAVGFTPDMIAGYPAWDPLVSYPAPYFVGFESAVYEVMFATTPGQSPTTDPGKFKKITTPIHDQNTDLFLAIGTASEVSAATLRGIADRVNASSSRVRIAPVVNPSSAPYGLDIHGVGGIGFKGVQILNFEGSASSFDDAILSFAIQVSNYRGMRLPRMTTANRNLISSPQPGLFIDNSNVNNPEYRGASAWHKFILQSNDSTPTTGTVGVTNANGYLDFSRTADFFIGKTGANITSNPSQNLTLYSSNTMSIWSGGGQINFGIASENNLGSWLTSGFRIYAGLGLNIGNPNNGNQSQTIQIQRRTALANNPASDTGCFYFLAQGLDLAVPHFLTGGNVLIKLYRQTSTAIGVDPLALELKTILQNLGLIAP